ncbi:MAG: hypothetical protein ABI183_23875 [Polyangiaceae bacterium]
MLPPVLARLDLRTSLGCQNPPPLDPTVLATVYPDTQFIYKGVPGGV